MADKVVIRSDIVLCGTTQSNDEDTTQLLQLLCHHVVSELLIGENLLVYIEPTAPTVTCRMGLAPYCVVPAKRTCEKPTFIVEAYAAHV